MKGMNAGFGPASVAEAADAPSSQVISIDHIAIAVEDLAAAVEWYRTKLGFSLQEERVTEGMHTAMLSAVMVSGAAVIVLVQGLSPQSQVSRFIEEFGPGVQHVALAVRDMSATMSQVTQAAGKSDTPLMVGEGLRQAFLHRDAGSGVRIELIERRGGTFSDESVKKLFLAFEEHDLF